jgi:hypothetical protein
MLPSLQPAESLLLEAVSGIRKLWPDCHLTLIGVTLPRVWYQHQRDSRSLAIGGGEAVPNKPFTANGASIAIFSKPTRQQ